MPIDKPLFGLGLPRTGSTALSFLLAQDPDVRYLRSWESGTPCPPPSTVQGDDPRIPPEAQRVVGAAAGTTSRLDVHGPMECLDLMALDFKSQIFQAFAQIPSYSEWFARRPISRRRTSTSVACSSCCMGRADPAVAAEVARARDVRWTIWTAVFPDARFVMTHRDPTDVIVSVADVYADIVGGFTDHLDRPYLGQLNVSSGRSAWSAR